MATGSGAVAGRTLAGLARRVCMLCSWYKWRPRQRTTTSKESIIKDHDRCSVPYCAGEALMFGVCLTHRLEETTPTARELDQAVDEIRSEERLREEARARMARQKVLDNPPPAGGSRYGQVALERTCADVAGLHEGGRNNELSRAAYRIGGLVGSGHIQGDQAREALERAGEACGLPREEVKSVVRRGLRKGAEKPWVPEGRGAAPAFSGGGKWGSW